MACRSALRTTVFSDVRSLPGGSKLCSNTERRLSANALRMQPVRSQHIAQRQTCLHIKHARGLKTTPRVRFAADPSEPRQTSDPDEAAKQEFAEGMLSMLEGRAISCADSKALAFILTPSPTPEKYYAAIVNNMRLMESFLGVVGEDAFREADVDEGTVIARGREAFMMYSRIHDDWMEKALKSVAIAKGSVDSDLLQIWQYLNLNVQLMNIYLQGDTAPPPRPTWKDIGDAIILHSNWSRDILDKAAGGVHPDQQMYRVDLKPGQGTEPPS